MESPALDLWRLRVRAAGNEMRFVLGPGWTGRARDATAGGVAARQGAGLALIAEPVGTGLALLACHAGCLPLRGRLAGWAYENRFRAHVLRPLFSCFGPRAALKRSHRGDR